MVRNKAVYLALDVQADGIGKWPKRWVASRNSSVLCGSPSEMVHWKTPNIARPVGVRRSGFPALEI